MAFKHFPVTALALVMMCSQPVESERNQYENRENEPHAVRLLSEATDSMLQFNAPRRSGSIEKETNTDTDSSSYTANIEAGRTKRGLSHWTGRQVQLARYESFVMWKPPAFQLSRPYFIPVYGAPGRVPIYFPPQRFSLNPGTPMDNPRPRPYQGPIYLPPKEYPSSTMTTEKPMNINNRFEGEDDDDDRPVWDMSPPSTVKPNNIVPTRAPRPPNMPDFPPLVHDANSETNFLSVDQSRKENSVNLLVPTQTTTSRPAVGGPSNCAWAIVSCCSAASNSVSNNCFEQRGCPGPFWGQSPCDSDYAKAAIQSALKYFNQ